MVYIPFGEVFVEERNGNWASPYLFNAKELDEETGLYYYGARYLDPIGAVWLSVDPKWEDYSLMTPYNSVMKEVGKYNQIQNKGNGYNMCYPYYGEHTYSGSYIYYGYFNKFYK